MINETSVLMDSDAANKALDADAALLSVGAEAGTGTSNSENNLALAIRQGASQSFNQVGEQVVGRSLNVQPTITIRPGFPVRVMVTHDLVLEPYGA